MQRWIREFDLREVNGRMSAIQLTSVPVSAWRTVLERIPWFRSAVLTKGDAGLLAGAGILLSLGMLALVGPLLTVDPLRPDPEAILAPPTPEHLMGTDAYGRDILARSVAALRLDFLIAFAVAIIAFSAGSLIGAVSGYAAGRLDMLIMRVVEIVQSFPAFILAIGITAMLGNSVQNVIIAVAVAYTPYFIRLVRAEMLAARALPYARAAKCMGNSPLRIMLYHLLPNCLGPAVVQGTLVLGWSILDVAGLSFLGLGIRPPTPELGVLVAEGTQYINSGQWWISVFPGLIILFAVFGFMLVGERLRAMVQSGRVS